MILRLPSWSALLAAAALAACGPRSTTIGLSCPGGPGAIPPVDRELDSALGTGVATGSTRGARNDVSPRCGSSRAEDVTFHWTAPAAGTYSFDTNGSRYDTVLAVFDVCSGRQLACNDDGGTGLNSRVQLTLAAGQELVIVVDGFSAGAGDFVLNITGSGLVDGGVDVVSMDAPADAPADAPMDARMDVPTDVDLGMCPERELGSMIGSRVATGTTVGQGNHITQTCSRTSTTEDVTFRWTAPEEGVYQIDTNGSSFDTYLAVRDGDCAGMDLACNDDGGSGTASLVTVTLRAGQTVVIDVDGFSSEGNFVLNISRRAGADVVEAGVDAADVATDAPADAPPEAGADVVCPAGQTACGGACVDTRTDGLHCGACGNACPAGQACAAGVCACPVGLTDCGGRCVDTRTDPTHCGSCGFTCVFGTTCAAGRCECGPGLSLCAGMCVDTRTDIAHCGGCDRACASGQSCTSSVCACPAGQTACGGTCVDTGTDRLNCGACGNACAADRACASGACVCVAPLTECAGACVDLQSDPANCGACGNACTAPRPNCVSGACVR